MTKFQEAVERLREEGRRRGLDISAATAQDILADLVTNTAAALGIREETFVRSHLPNVDLADLVAHLKQADDAQKREVAGASPAVVSMEGTGRLIASLPKRCGASASTTNDWRRGAATSGRPSASSMTPATA